MSGSGLTVWILIGVSIFVVLSLLFPIWASSRRNRRMGGRGVVQRSRLVCPKCHQTFDYDWVPGMALTAFRIGDARYMACPLCRKWSFFDVAHAPSPQPSGRE